MEMAVCYGSAAVARHRHSLGSTEHCKTGDGEANQHGLVWLDSVKSVGGVSCLNKPVDNLLRWFDVVWLWNSLWRTRLDVRSQVCCHLVASLCSADEEQQKLMIRNGGHKWQLETNKQASSTTQKFPRASFQIVKISCYQQGERDYTKVRKHIRQEKFFLFSENQKGIWQRISLQGQVWCFYVLYTLSSCLWLSATSTSVPCEREYERATVTIPWPQ